MLIRWWPQRDTIELAEFKCAISLRGSRTLGDEITLDLEAWACAALEPDHWVMRGILAHTPTNSNQESPSRPESLEPRVWVWVGRRWCLYPESGRRGASFACLFVLTIGL